MNAPNLLVPEKTVFPQSILVVEDDEGLAELLRLSLRNISLPINWSRTGEAALEKLSADAACLMLLDYSLPDMTAMELVETLSKRGAVPPFVVITGHGDERVAVTLMKLGAKDYLVKDALLLERVPALVARVLREMDVCQKLYESERALHQNEKELSAIYDHTPTLMLLVDGQMRLRKANAAAAAVKEALAKRPGLTFGEAFKCRNAANGAAGCGSAGQCGNCVLRRSVMETLASGQGVRQRELELSLEVFDSAVARNFLISTIRLEMEDSPEVLVCMEDMTEWKTMENQLRQAQRMEAVGQLAGGIAHDFNNLISVMLMQVESMESLCAEGQTGPQMMESVKEIEAAAKRAAALTRHLLAFSRRQVLQVKPLDINEVIGDLLKMLRRVLGEQIKLEFRSEAGALWVEADAGMLEQVLMNLSVNARDAMPRGGCLSISTHPADASSQALAGKPRARAGSWVCLEVADTGCGMDEATLKRIFEPFFTTKEVGKGTGLGLSTVYGIVQQHQGWLDVESAPGKGTTFQVFLPRLNKQLEPSQTTKPVIQCGSEKILLVEDDPAVLLATAGCLRRRGYQVVTAASGKEALAAWDQQGGDIDLLLTDMIMPEQMNGLELGQQIRAKKPGVKVILSSGYSSELVAKGIKLERVIFLPKPCDFVTLTNAVRKCLDEK